MIGQAMSQHKKTHVYLGFSHSLSLVGKANAGPVDSASTYNIYRPYGWTLTQPNGLATPAMLSGYLSNSEHLLQSGGEIRDSECRSDRERLRAMRKVARALNPSG